MPLTQKHRSSLYRTLSPLLGEEEAEALLSQFPSSETDELVTRGHLSGEIADVRIEMRTEFAAVRTEMRTEFAAVRTEIAELRAEMHSLIRQQTAWFIGAMAAGLSIASAIAALA